ncbi:hypothetical protein [Psychromonas aquimarina]|uniref:TapB family protein n=1 Tax=Psychromonas aquimarina TaxID=444919 RepID=UPI000416A100|nr:hypothetical protein [Psychromonas aquimarina]
MKRNVLLVVISAAVISGCDGDDGIFFTKKKDPAVKPAVSTTAAAVENASTCFNDKLYKVGSGYNLTTQKGTEPAETQHYKVLEDARYRGQPAIHQRLSKSTKLTDRYLFINTGEKSVSLLGEKVLKDESYYAPGYLVKFNVKKGGSYSQTVTMTEESSKPARETVSNIKTTFKGIETITVPAGTYKTCRFELNSSVTKPDGLTKKLNSSVWYAVKHGVKVQSKDNAGSITKLIKGDINGTKI